MEPDYPIKPLGNKILVEFVPVNEKLTTKSGIIIDNPQAKESRKYAALIRDVGEEVDIENANYNIGDKIIFNEYDLMAIDVPHEDNPNELKKFGLIQDKNVFGIFKR